MAYDGTKGVNGNSMLTFWTLVKNWVRNTFQSRVTGGASTITDNDLTAGRALVSDSNGKVSASDITSTVLGYLSGLTSNAQTQLNGKQGKITFLLGNGQQNNNVTGLTSGGNVKLNQSGGAAVQFDAECLPKSIRVDGSDNVCNALQLVSGSGILLSYTDGVLTVSRVALTANDIASALGYTPVSQSSLTSIQSALSGLSSRVDAMHGFRYQIVDGSLPSSGEENVLYLVSADPTNADSNVYDQYLYITVGTSGRWEKIGDTRVDLSGYVQDTDFLSASEITELFNSVA